MVLFLYPIRWVNCLLRLLIVRNGPLPVFQVLRICLKGFLLLSAVSFQAPSLFFTDATDELFILKWRQPSSLPLLLNLSLLLFGSNNLLTPFLVTFFFLHYGNPFPELEERVMSFPVYRAVQLLLDQDIVDNIIPWCPCNDKVIPVSALPMWGQPFFHDTPHSLLFFLI